MWRVTDRWGNTIELTDERWAYISRWHPDLSDLREEVLNTIKFGHRRQDALDPCKYVYYRETDALWPDYNYIIAVVKLVRNNFVITAYPKFIER